MKLLIDTQIKHKVKETGYPEKIILASLAERLWPDSSKNAQYQNLRLYLRGDYKFNIDQFEIMRQFFNCEYKDLISIES
jgi:hypothetical protein